MNIRFNPVRGLKEVRELIASLPRGVKHAFIEAFSEYIVGNEHRGLKHEPPQRVHDENNPYQWTTEKQRRAFFATDGFGQGIPTVRTHEGVNSWTVKTQDSDWTRVRIEGGNKFVQGDNQQRGHAAVGWRKYADIVQTNLSGAMNSGLAAVNKVLSSIGGMRIKK
jgi:hypothetical protein